jgi:hypothetical protein
LLVNKNPADVSFVSKQNPADVAFVSKQNPADVSFVSKQSPADVAGFLFTNKCYISWVFVY